MSIKKITNGSPESRSADLLGENLEALKSLFPEAFTEGKVDFEVLKQLLGGAVDEREEKFGLNWHGKRQARQLALTPSTGTLRPCPEESVDWDTTQNLMIEGDNLEVLKLLQKSYAGKVKLIYIDPPYNTGKDFIYPDDYQDSIKNYQRITGQVDREGRKLSTNTETSGRFHTDWLNMMYPRLKLARNLLCQNGAILCSIDDKEACRLRCLLDEIFGEENFLAQFSWRTDGNFDNQAKIKVCHEYIVMYARSTEDFPHPPVVDPNTPPNSKLFRPEIRNTIVKNGPKNPISKITLPVGFPASFTEGSVGQESSWPKYSSEPRVEEGKLTNQVTAESGWSSKDLALEFINNDCQPIKDNKNQETSFALTRTGAIEIIKRRSDIQSHVISVLNGFGGTQKATTQLAEIGAFFNGYPKPVDLIRYLVRMVQGVDGVFLDFFAGAGPLGQAIYEQNAADSGSRRYVVTQLPEPLDPSEESQREAAAFCDKLGRPRSIAELTKHRLRCSGSKVRKENPMFSGDLGFRVFKLDTSNIRAWEPKRDALGQTLIDNLEHLRPDRSEQDVLYELLLKLGLDLCVPIEKKAIAGKPVHSIGGGVLFACLGKKIAVKDAEPLALGIVEWRKELAPAGESTCVFRDSDFADDVAKTNLAAILEQHGISKVRSI